MPGDEVDERYKLLRSSHKVVLLLSKEFEDLQDSQTTAGHARKRAVALQMCAGFWLQVAAEDSLHEKLSSLGSRGEDWSALLVQRMRILGLFGQINPKLATDKQIDDQVPALSAQIRSYIRSQRETVFPLLC